jgi:hypothetical protein
MPTVDLLIISVSTGDLRDDLQPPLIFCRSAQIEPSHKLVLFCGSDLTDVVTSQVASPIGIQLAEE